MTSLDVYKVVKKLLGEIKPVGDSDIDRERFENLENTCDLIDWLLTDVDNVIPYKRCHQNSMKKAGEYADEFFDKYGIE